MMKFKLLFLLSSTLIYFSLPASVFAARQRSRKPSEPTVYVSRGVSSRVRFRPDRLGLVINFSNFDNLASGRYELIYESNGVTQAAGGSIILGDTTSKELLFGTCSGGVCRWHENITNARLSIVSVLKDGTTVLKPYRIRV
jgi:hypothetical protein